MALTIATGFVVDDAIVMIENIARYIEEGETPLEAALKGSRADRLHDHLADVLADRRADPAAVHGRRRRPAVPRVRDHAGGRDPDLGGGVADADADDVRAAAAPHAAARSRAASIARAASVLRPRDRALRRDAATGCSTARRATLLVARRHAGADRACSTSSIPKGFFPVQDTGVIQGISEAPQTISFAAMAERQQALARRHPRRTRRWRACRRSSASTAPTRR